MTAKYLHSSPQTIIEALKRCNIDYKEPKGKTVYVTTEEGILIKEFESIAEAGRWLYRLDGSRCNTTYENLIRKSMRTDTTVLGFRFDTDKPLEQLQEYHIICRKIEPQYGNVVSYIERSLLDKNILQVLNKNKLYKGFI